MSFAGSVAARPAQADPDVAAETTPFLDNKLLDEWRLPFGDWMEQAVFWIDNNLEPVLEAFAWPFETLIRFLVRDFLSDISWFWVVLAMMIIAWLTRNFKVAAFVGVSLFVCGILGSLYWLQTARTIGFIGVAVIMCVIIGIPVGIACGRVDTIWHVVRPILDAMQVVHSFVYMLPFIWFFGIGEVSATMVTMVFALPPLIRLTNLGIRQVPEDVVEASRAYGARELTVLFDVQIPLARPAIMTGINQTLLLAISMLGIAAIMGAGGLGQLLFKAINNQDTTLAASAGLAFFLVAVALDRMSQREGHDTENLFKRIWLAWAHRRDPEALMPHEDTSAVVKHIQDDRFAQVTSSEVRWMWLTLVGGVITAISVLLAWTSDAGKLSAYGRWDDASLNSELQGMSFSGLSASGGSWIGIMVGFCGLFVVASVMVSYLRPGRGPRWLVVDGSLIASIAALMLALVFLLAQPLDIATDPGTGIGVWLAILGGIISVAGSALWIRKAPHSPLHPLRADISWGSLIGVGVACIILVVGMISGWSFDERGGQIITPEIQAELERIERDFEEHPENMAALVTEYQVTVARARIENLVITDGVSGKGPQLGLWALVGGALAALAVLPAAGVIGRDEKWRWRWNAVTAGIGVGITAVALGWILTHLRSAHPNYVSGIGSFLALIAGVAVVASTMTVLREYRRSRVYDSLEGYGQKQSASASHADG